MEIIEVVNIFLWVYGVFFAFLALFGFAVQRNKERGYKEGEKIESSEISVLIPFRNEAANLPALIESIKNLEQLPRQFIFIDDASEDNSAALLNDLVNELPITLIRNDNAKPGKKFAIREGAKLVETEYTLTWDADIVVSSDYFQAISKLSKADMYVLPAVFKTKSFLQALFTFDVVVANAVNAGISGWRRPIFASGANLLYRTELFTEFDTIENHKHISSGDDTFLLRDFYQNKADVRVSTEPTVSIKTDAPKTFKTYISQRLRWVSKTNALGDPLNSVIALAQLLFMAAFVGIVTATVYQSAWFALIYLFICKCLTDFLVFSAYFKQIKQSALLLMLPIAELWFPLYSLLLAVLIPFHKPQWKGRTIVSK